MEGMAAFAAIRTLLSYLFAGCADAPTHTIGQCRGFQIGSYSVVKFGVASRLALSLDAEDVWQ
jgi:hypothetical protein